jgi:hypothetical protein
MTINYLNHCLRLALRGCVVGSSLLSIVPPVNAAQNSDHWVGVYGADLQGTCDVQPLFKVRKEAGKLVAYVRGDDAIWHRAEPVFLSSDELNEFLKGKDPRGVSVLGLQEIGAIIHAPKGWRYDEKFTTQTGDFALMGTGGTVDLQRANEAEAGPDLQQKERLLCLKNRNQTRSDETE